MIKFNNLGLTVILSVLAYVIIEIPIYALHATITDLPGALNDSKVAIKKTENSNFIKAKVNDLIRENGIIVTGKGADSKVELLIENASCKAIVRLGSQSYLKLTSSSDKVKLLLDEGKVLVQNTGSLNLNVYVGNYVASSEGTTFTVDVLEPGDTSDQINVEVEVLEGQVRFNKDGDDLQKAYYILPGEKAKFNLKFNKLANATLVKDINIEKLESIGMFDPIRIESLNKQINNFNSSSVELVNTQFQQVKIEMNGPLFEQFKDTLQKDNLEKVKQNQELQNQDQLESKNNELRQKLLPQGNSQLNDSIINNLDSIPINEDKSIIDNNNDSINIESDIEIDKTESNKVKESSEDLNIQDIKVNKQNNVINNTNINKESNKTKSVNEQPKVKTKQYKHSNTVILSSPSSNSANSSKSGYYSKPKKNKVVKQPDNSNTSGTVQSNQSKPTITRPDIDRNPPSAPSQLPSKQSLPSR